MPCTAWRAVIVLLFIGSTVFAPVICRESLHEGILQQSEATTTLSLVHSVSRSQQPEDSIPRLQTRAGRRRRHKQSFQDTDQASVTDDFDWEAYLALNSDLSVDQYGSQNRAWQHYRDFVQHDKRLRRLPDVILRYTAATGLSNQHYCHIAAFSLCAVLGRCSIVLPPAVARSSFQDAFSVFKEFNKVQWSAMPLETLYDTDKIVAEWGRMGLQVWKTPPLQELPALVEPQNAFPSYVDQHDARLVTKLTDVYLRAYGMAELVEMVTAAVAETAQQYMLSGEADEAPYIVVDLPVALFMLRSSDNLHLVSKVASKLYFAPVVHQLADKVLQGLFEHAPYFNGAHLRVEADAMDWAKSMGGIELYWGEFLKAMHTASFRDGVQLYVATGLLSYAAGHATLKELTLNLTAEGLCDRVTFKEQFLTTAELDALHSEQKALVDLLVLARAHSFVGFEPSTFSFFLSQYRVLQGLDPASSVLVEGKVIGTNPLFEAAAVVVEKGFQQQRQEERQVDGIVSNRRMMYN